MSEYQRCKNYTGLATLAVIGIIISSMIPVHGESITPKTSLYDISPLKQFKSGTEAKDIQCKEGSQLIIKAEDNSPACVKPSSATRLVSMGWAMLPENITSTRQDQSSENKIITLADNDKKINLKEGESFLLKLGDNYNWNIVIDNQTVVSRMMNIMVVKGAQGIYEAHSPGLATFTGIGEPLCLTDTTPCKIHSIPFVLNVVVGATPTSSNTNSSLAVSTEKTQYKIGEIINFTITNNGNSRIFPNGWGYSINGFDGKHYAPNGVLRMMLVALPPGNSTSWTWDQTDANNTQVSLGKYNLTASYTEENTQNQISASKIIEIIS